MSNFENNYYNSIENNSKNVINTEIVRYIKNTDNTKYINNFENNR